MAGAERLGDVLNLSCVSFGCALGTAQQGCAAGAAQVGLLQDRVPRRLEAGGEQRELPGLRADKSPCKLLKVWL